MDTLPLDDTKLKQTIRLLCNTGVRHPLTWERVRIWLTQFHEPEEKTLALLILRHLIYRTSMQISSALRQALKATVYHFSKPDIAKPFDWKAVLSNGQDGLDFLFGPPAHEFTSPGKSGELIVRLLKTKFSIDSSKLKYPESIGKLEADEHFFLVDDGMFTGDQISGIIESRCTFMLGHTRAGLILAISHEHAIQEIKKKFPNLSIFCGETLSSSDGFEEISKSWVDNGLWQYSHVDPYTLYHSIVDKASFSNKQPLGHGGLGLLVAYEHGIPDNSLQILWDKSEAWNPLIER